MLYSASVKCETEEFEAMASGVRSLIWLAMNVGAPLLRPALSVVAAPSVMFGLGDIVQSSGPAGAPTSVQLEMAEQVEVFRPYSRLSGLGEVTRLWYCTALPSVSTTYACESSAVIAIQAGRWVKR